MQHGSDPLFCLGAVTHLHLFARFPDQLSDHTFISISSRLQSLNFRGFGIVPAYFVYVLANLTALTQLTLAADTFPQGVSACSCLKQMKQLQLESSGLSDTNLMFAFVSRLPYLVLLSLEKFSLNDENFMQPGFWF